MDGNTFDIFPLDIMEHIYKIIYRVSARKVA